MSEYLVSADLGDGPAIYGMIGVSGLTSRVARWRTDHWEPLGPAPSGGPVPWNFSLLVAHFASGDALYISGRFTDIGGVPVPGFARWNGQAWEPAGDADETGIILDWATFDDGSGPALFAPAGIMRAGQQYRGLLKFDGQHWSLVGEMDPPTAIYSITDLTVFDDGRGPAIYIGGSFPNFGGVPAHGIARYDRNGWSTLGEGVHGGEVISIAAMPTPRGPSLFMTGGFTTAGGGAVIGTARWIGCPNCYVNCDQSTAAPTLNVNDFLCFMTRFALHAPEANCTNDAAIDVADFVCFMQRFAAGCP